MKKNQIISINKLDNKTAQLFSSYCFLIKNKLDDDWFFTYKDMPNITAIPKSYDGDISENTNIIMRVGRKNQKTNLLKDEYDFIVDIDIPFSSNQIISEFNKISKHNIIIDKTKKNAYSFKKKISKLFQKYIHTVPKKLKNESKVMIKNSKTNALLKLVDPNYKNNLKVVFLGRPGAGKTTAIVSAQSEGLVNCEVNATDTVGMLKNQTTIGIDYCQCNFNNGVKLRLFGTPGQGRYNQLQLQTVETADICIILIDLTSVAPYSEFKYYNNILESANNKDALKVVLLTHCDQNEHNIKSLSQEILRSTHGAAIISKVDPRDREDVRRILKIVSNRKIQNEDGSYFEPFSTRIPI